MSTQRIGGGNFEDWESHNQWMEYDTFEEVSLRSNRTPNDL